MKKKEIIFEISTRISHAFVQKTKEYLEVGEPDLAPIREMKLKEVQILLLRLGDICYNESIRILEEELE